MTLKTAIWQLARRSSVTSRVLALRSLSRVSHLQSSGWFESFRKGLSVDASGSPIPWYTYGAIHFLASRVNSTMSVFEYGSGNSTLWWSKLGGRVTSCEHDTQWHRMMKERLPAAVKYIHADVSTGDYARQIQQQHETFDIVVIDGRDRVQCARFSAAALATRGVIVWDNSDRPDYRDGYEFLVNQGFRRVDFWGMGPINTYEWSTSIFYRSDNCLGL
ncbi:MAG: class I SAM-dependent methyltransferase [Caldimonas sp.]